MRGEKSEDEGENNSRSEEETEQLTQTLLSMLTKGACNNDGLASTQTNNATARRLWRLCCLCDDATYLDELGRKEGEGQRMDWW
jgi:hypothetical protein